MVDIDTILSPIEISDSILSSQESQMSLGLFFKFLEYIKERLPDIKDIKDQLLFCEFSDLIHDLNHCAISGGALLDYRLGKQPKANDLDFFISGHENQKIVQKFFTSNKYYPLFRDFNDLFQKNEANGLYEVTVQPEYAFHKKGFKVSTSRFTFDFRHDCGFNLNFIFLEELTPTERTLIGLPKSYSDSLYNDSLYKYKTAVSTSSVVLNPTFFKVLPLSNDDIENNTPNAIETQKLFEIYPHAFPLHFIHDSFDFEELKYVYSFELQQPISIYIAGKLLLENFKNKLDKKPTFVVNSRLETRVTNKIKHLAERNKLFMQQTQDIDTLNISISGFSPDLLSDLKRFNNDALRFQYTLDEIFGRTNFSPQNLILNTKGMEFLANIIPRIDKYSKRGFKIKDENLIIANIRYYQILYNLFLSNNTFITKCSTKELLLCGITSETKKLKLILESIKSDNNISKELNINQHSESSHQK